MSQTPLRNRTVFGADCRMQGHMELDNDAAILGRFEGTLKVTGKLDLLESARFNGLIITGSLRLAGKVDADVIASQSVELLPGAELRGRLYTPRLTVAEGVVFEADACIGPNAAPAAEKRLAQIDLQAHLQQTSEAQERYRHARIDADDSMELDDDLDVLRIDGFDGESMHDEGGPIAGDQIPGEAPLSLSIAADEQHATDIAAADTAQVIDENPQGEADDPAQVRTMSEAFERILNYRPTKAVRPSAPRSDAPAA